ncbi:MAG: potassium-transporting ATPase subunit KdpC [Gammaproteobacteria bacterium]
MWLTTCRLFGLLLLLTGGIYPLVITGVAQLCFPWQANGSMLVNHGIDIGSQWIGQNFTSEAYFWGRPSAITEGLASGGSNLSLSNPELLAAFKSRIAERHLFKLPIPGDLVMASGSGLDPEISVAAAYYQIDRIAQSRKLSVAQVQRLIQEHIQDRSLGFLGEPRVNVLSLNLALNELSSFQ